MSSPRTHHDFSPSRLARLAACPGSYNAEKDLPDTPSEAAQEGTLMHGWMEQRLRRGYTEAIDGVEPTLDQRETLDMVWDRVLQLCDGHRYAISLERRMSLRHWSGELTSGYCDLLAIPRDGIGAAILIDYKFGRVEVDSHEARWQLGAYAAMALQEFPMIDAVEARILQPRVAGGMDRAPMEFRDADSIAGKIHRVVCACRTPGAALIPDADHQCRYCRAAAAGTCPAIKNAMLITGFTAEVMERNGDDRDKAVAELDDEGLAALVEQGRLASRLADAAEAELRRRVEAAGPQGVCGWTLQSTPGRRKAEPLKAWEAVRGDLAPEEYMACCDVSLPKLEAMWCGREVEAGRQPNKTAAKKALGEALGDAVTRGEPAMRLVHG